jgi:hypothetical protein
MSTRHRATCCTSTPRSWAASDYDFGTLLNYNDLSGVITKQPPTVKHIVQPLLPAVDGDGNEVSGYPSVLHQVPLGTYTGWNPTARGWFAGQVCGGGLTGGFIAFATTAAQRTASGDPRLSLEERYGSVQAYVCAVTKAVAREEQRRMLLPADGTRLISQAAASTFLPATPVTPAAVALAGLLCGS